MSPSRCMIGILTFCLLLISSPSAFASVFTNEVSASYASFTSNIGGLSTMGAKLRLEELEIGAMELDGSFSCEVSFAHQFHVKSFVVPRLILGAGLAYGSLNLVTGVGFTFPLFRVFDGKVGLSLDNYIYAPLLFRGRIGLIPVIPLSITFLF